MWNFHKTSFKILCNVWNPCLRKTWALLNYGLYKEMHNFALSMHFQSNQVFFLIEYCRCWINFSDLSCSFILFFMLWCYSVILCNMQTHVIKSDFIWYYETWRGVKHKLLSNFCIKVGGKGVYFQVFEKLINYQNYENLNTFLLNKWNIIFNNPFPTTP